MKNLKNLPSLIPSFAVQTLALSGLVASVMFAAKPAQAASLTYNWSFSGLANTGGTFVADDATGLLSEIAGTVGGDGILGLDGRFGKEYWVGTGFSFLSDTKESWWDYPDSPTVWSLSYDLAFLETFAEDDGGEAFLSGLGLNFLGYGGFGTFSYSPAAASPSPAAVPEPLTILGSITAAGFGVAFKRKKNSTKEE